jgi:hypothetical protein
MKLRSLILATLVAAGGLLAPASVAAQQTESRIIGRLLDESKAALPGVNVTVTSKQTGAVRAVVSGPDGNYAVTNLYPGSYTVSFDLAGFTQQSREVRLGIAHVETLDVQLIVGAISEAVTVMGASPVAGHRHRLVENRRQRVA